MFQRHVCLQSTAVDILRQAVANSDHSKPVKLLFITSARQVMTPQIYASKFGHLICPLLTLSALTASRMRRAVLGPSIGQPNSSQKVCRNSTWQFRSSYFLTQAVSS